MNLKLALPFAFLTLSACAPLYTPPTHWVSANNPEADLRPALTECVTDFDPVHLSQMDNGGDYSPTGLFVDTSRTQAVVSCMEAKGWDAEGWDWYSGPQR